jgi:signal transduction histidine kinase
MASVPTVNRLKPGGLVVALVGFVLTRYFVASAIRMELPTLTFLLTQLPFLLSGLALATLGIVLAIGDRRSGTVNTVARWCLLGVVAVLVVFVTAARPPVMVVDLQSGPLVPRFLVAGAVAGALTGVHSARANERRGELARRADRQLVLNRLLRHEILNKLAIVRGYAALEGADAAERVQRNADRIEDVIDRVGFLVDAPADAAVIDLTAAVRDAVRKAREQHPAATIRLVGDDPPLEVRAVPRIDTAIGQLVTNAVEHAEVDAPEVTVRVDADAQSARVVVVDAGPGLPEPQRALLTERSLPEFDDPTSGFGLAIVRLLLDESDAIADVSTDGGTAITLTFARAYDGTAGGVAVDRLLEATAAALIAGVCMGALLTVLTGTMPVIGALYGVQNPIIGWIVHLFHSVVFGVALAAVVWHPRWRSRLGTPSGAVVAGVSYGLALTLLAAGVVMPLWLQVVGIRAPLPNLSPVGLVGHLVWGAVLGALLIGFRGADGGLRGVGGRIRDHLRADFE